MFTILEENHAGLHVIKLFDTKTHAYASILPDFGGNVNDLVLPDASGALVSVIDGYHTLADAQANNGYKSAKLLPYPNRIADGLYVWENEPQQFDINRPTENNSIHGLWHSETMTVVNKKHNERASAVTLEFRYDGTTVGYPFACRVRVTYKFSKKGFVCTTEIKNTGTRPMPFADGWHPYFRLDTETPVDAYTIQIPAARRLAVDARMIPTGKSVVNRKFRTPVPLAANTLDTGYELTSDDLDAKKRATTRITLGSRCLEVWQQASEGAYRYLQIYTPPTRNTIAIEPMTAAANAFNRPEHGLQTIAPKEKWVGKYGVRMITTEAK